MSGFSTSGAVSRPKLAASSSAGHTHFPVDDLPLFRDWLPTFLRDELRPYPGRGLLMLRYVVAATIIMLAIVTFHIPAAGTGAFFSVLLPRESPASTFKYGVSLLVSVGSATAITLVGAILFVDYPLTHFLWVAATFFLAFYLLSSLSNYSLASAFCIVTVVSVPEWDASIPTAAIVTQNLWVGGSIALSAVVVVVTEAIFGLFNRHNLLDDGLVERLAALATFLDQPISINSKKIQQLATVGVSRLRQIALAQGGLDGEIARRSTIVAIVGRLIDLTATIEEVPQSVTARRSALAVELRKLSAMLTGTCDEAVSRTPASTLNELAILVELEQNVESLRLVLTRQTTEGLSIDGVTPTPPGLFKRDAWTNPDHLRFGIRGGLAAFACYVTMRAIAWPELSAALFTCVVTALTSIGSSRQKQVLRVIGAITGSVLIGMTGQILILPMLDTIGGFTLYFVLAVLFASWFITAGPRLNYYGVQIALGFFLVNLATPYPEFSLATSRNIIAGILLGLIAMWLIFDQLWAKPAAQLLTQTFASNLKLMSQLATPWPPGKTADLASIRSLREQISQNFTIVNNQSDGILFELGPQRKRSLEVRSVFHAAQPLLRTIFLLEVATFQYRLRIAPDSIPPAVLAAQTRFDESLSQLFKQLAAVVNARSCSKKPTPASFIGIEAAHKELVQQVSEFYEGEPIPRAQAILSLSSHLVSSARCLDAYLGRTPALPT